MHPGDWCHILLKNNSKLAIRLVNIRGKHWDESIQARILKPEGSEGYEKDFVVIAALLSPSRRPLASHHWGTLLRSYITGAATRVLTISRFTLLQGVGSPKPK
jgi:hypothetical protein